MAIGTEHGGAEPGGAEHRGADDRETGGPVKDRRADFIEATLACMADHGHQGTTVRRIADYAGVVPGLLTHYFSGKDALIAAAYREMSDRLHRHVVEVVEAAGADPVARLSAFLATSFRPPSFEPAQLKLWVGYWSFVLSDPAVRRIHAETYARYRVLVVSLVGPVLEAKGRVADDSEVEALAIGISALLDGLWLEHGLDASAFGSSDAEGIAREMIGARLGIDLSV